MWTGSLMMAGALLGQDLTGTWQLSSKDGDGNTVKSEITFREEGGELKAVITAKDGSIDVKRIKREGAKAVFEIQWQDDLIGVELAPVAGGKLEGKWKAGEDEGPISGVKAGGGWNGLWKLSATRPNGGTTRLEVDIQGEKAVFKTTEGQEIPAQQLKIAGNDLTVDLVLPQATVKVTLKLEGNSVKGNYAVGDGTTGPVEGVR